MALHSLAINHYLAAVCDDAAAETALPSAAVDAVEAASSSSVVVAAAAALWADRSVSAVSFAVVLQLLPVGPSSSSAVACPDAVAVVTALESLLRKGGVRGGG